VCLSGIRSVQMGVINTMGFTVKGEVRPAAH
jgi:hypothetical protein